MFSGCLEHCNAEGTLSEYSWNIAYHTIKDQTYTIYKSTHKSTQKQIMIS